MKLVPCEGGKGCHGFIQQHHLYTMVGEEYDLAAFRSLAEWSAAPRSADRLSAIREDSKSAENRIRIPIVFLVLAIIGLIGPPPVARFVNGDPRLRI